MTLYSKSKQFLKKYQHFCSVANDAEKKLNDAYVFVPLNVGVIEECALYYLDVLVQLESHCQSRYDNLKFLSGKKEKNALNAEIKIIQRKILSAKNRWSQFQSLLKNCSLSKNKKQPQSEVVGNAGDGKYIVSSSRESNPIPPISSVVPGGAERFPPTEVPEVQPPVVPEAQGNLATANVETQQKAPAKSVKSNRTKRSSTSKKALEPVNNETQSKAPAKSEKSNKSSKKSKRSSASKKAQDLKLKKLELQQKLEQSKLEYEMKKLEIKEKYNDLSSDGDASTNVSSDESDVPEDDIGQVPHNTYLDNVSKYLNDCEAAAAGRQQDQKVIGGGGDGGAHQVLGGGGDGGVHQGLKTPGFQYLINNDKVNRNFPNNSSPFALQPKGLFKTSSFDNNSYSLLRAQIDKPPEKKFDGDFLHFYPFIKNFEQTTLKLLSNEPELCLKRLIDSTTGKAYDSLLPFSLMSSNDPYITLTNALKELYSIFGNKNRIEREYVNKVKSGKTVHDNEDDLFTALVELRSCQTVLKATNSLACYGSSELVKGVVKRLPGHLKTEFNKVFSRLERRESTLSIDSLALIIDLVETRKNYHASSMAEVCRKSQSPPHKTAGGNKGLGNAFFSHGRDNRQNGGSSGSAGKGSSNQSATDQSGISAGKDKPLNKKVCPCCKSEKHKHVFSCPDFLNKTLPQRLSLIEKANSPRICSNCLRTGHKLSSCWSKQTCRFCSTPEKHHSLLCENATKKENVSTSSAVCQVFPSLDVTASAAKLETFMEKRIVHFQTAPIKVWNEDHNATAEIRVIFDPGSDRTYISQRCANQLSLSGPPTELRIQLADGTFTSCASRSVSLFGRGLKESYVHFFENVLILDKLPDISDKCFTKKMQKQYSHLKDVPVFSKWQDKELDMLIGIDQAECHILSDIRKGAKNEPFAGKSCLGWVIFGVQEVSDSEVLDDFTGNHTTAKLNWTKLSNERLHEQCKNMFTFDYPEYSKSDFAVSTSIQDDKALKVYKESVKKLDSGHYEVAIPFKSDKVDLPNNFSAAKRSLLALGKRLLTTRATDLPLYDAKMNELPTKLYSVDVPNDEISGPLGETWYSQHHSVVTSNKFRVVTNPSSAFQGKCLNSEIWYFYIQTSLNLEPL